MIYGNCTFLGSIFMNFLALNFIFYNFVTAYRISKNFKQINQFNKFKKNHRPCHYLIRFSETHDVRLWVTWFLQIPSHSYFWLALNYVLSIAYVLQFYVYKNDDNITTISWSASNRKGRPLLTATELFKTWKELKIIFI